MRRGRLLAGVIAGLTVCALGASAALAATPQQICQDLQDGRLDGHYSAADLAAFKADASVQGYCFLTVTPPSNAPSASAPSSGNAAPSSGQTSGVAGATKPAPTSTGGVAGAKASAPLATTKAKSGGLPFTGAQLTVALIIGGALLAGGLLLRVAARRGAG
jgi:hypothetical protein